jgi:xanthine/uracil/vitamin C permease (AzgA family)
MPRNPIRFDRNEFSGAFGDIGTDLPLIAGMILSCGLDSASVFIMFGVLQILTGGVLYGLPMPVQPLKVMAVLMISQKLSGNLLYGAGLAIGVVMLFLSVTGLLKWVAKIVPESVVRGVQFGLGVSLCMLALGKYVPSEGIPGWTLAAIGFVITLLLLSNRKYPPALFVIAIGVLYAAGFRLDFGRLIAGAGFAHLRLWDPQMSDIWQGFLVLALPQLALSISNSVVATQKTVQDLFPETPVSVRKIGLTYSLMNLIAPWFSGIPCCHGAGGLAGHYAFGARTGGSVVIYGSMYLVIGLFFSGCFDEILKIFPLPILGVVLLFEGLTLMSFIKKIADSKTSLFVALLVAMMAVGLPYGYLVGMIVGTLIVYLLGARAVSVS